MKKSLSLLLSAYCLVFSASAQVKDLTINAQNISYDQEKKLYEAQGSVEVVYQETKIAGEHIIYYTNKERVFADQGFSLSYNDINLEGKTIDFDIKNKEGEASDFHLAYQGIKLSGAFIQIGKEQFRLSNATFSTCDLDYPHYRVSALEINLYPQYGWLVAYWGFFWLQGIPLVPIPTYIYDLLAEEKGRRNLPPFPEVGSDDDYGTYVNERLAWHLRREFSGTYTISYLSRKGLGGGAEANYIINDSNQGNLRLYGNATDGLYGGLTHYYTFGQEVKAQQKPLAFLALPKYRNLELETTLSSRERINYERVSFLPNLILRLRRRELIKKEIKIEAELLAGEVAEERNIQLLRSGGRAKLSHDLPAVVLGDFTPSLMVDSLFYSNGGKWIKLSSGLELEKQFAEDFSAGIGYLHYFLVKGRSPFNFEMYRFSAVDRFTSRLSFMLGETGINLSASHYLPSWQAEDIDYSLFFRLHCYNLITTYRSLRREFSLGVSLVTR